MHKSVILFFSILVILLPLGNSLNISNANAVADFDKVDKKQVSVSSLKCNNINVNVNGLELDVFPPFLADSGIAAEAVEDNTDPISIVSGNGDNSEINDFRFICINNNSNTVVAEEEPPVPPTPPPGPPEPTTASLTVNKEIYGCANVEQRPPPPDPPERIIMNCTLLQNNDDGWIQCDDDDIPINGRSICDALPENLFDIRVVDDQNNQIIEPFQGSPTGTTIENLEPGTYTVEEIKHLTNINQLGENSDSTTICRTAGFTDGGEILIQNEEGQITFAYTPICFEYEDEQDLDCRTIVLAAGESRACTVKNYINVGQELTLPA